MSEELFGAVQAQLEENRQRRRDRPRGGRYLVQGLVVCKRCGYACYGKPVSRAAAKGKVPYAYYRCTGTDAYRFGGQRLCWNKQIRTDVLDAAVWEDVRQLLSEPERVRAEYQRRLQGPETGPEREAKHLSNMIANLKKMISRLIDAYGDGFLDKSEFEPRILAGRERLAKLEDECRQRIDEANQEAELRLVIGQLEEFARRVSQELQEPDWDTRREVVRALVKKVEIDEQEVRIVYRVSPSPFEGGPQQGSLQHCWGRDHPSLRRANRRGFEDSILHHPRGKKSFDQAEDVTVGHLGRHGCHDHAMREIVKEPLDIRVEYHLVPLAVEFQYSLDRLVAVAAGDESVRVFVKLWFKDRCKKPSNHLLGHAISHHGNAERSKLRRAGAFGNEDTAERQGLERSRFQLPHQRREVFLKVGSKHLNADLVHPRGPAIPLDGLEGLSHEPRGNPPGQRVYLDLLHGEPFTLCNHEVRTGGLLGMFLSVAAVAAFPWFPSKSTGRPIWGLSQGS